MAQAWHLWMRRRRRGRCRRPAPKCTPPPPPSELEERNEELRRKGRLLELVIRSRDAQVGGWGRVGALGWAAGGPAHDLGPCGCCWLGRCTPSQSPRPTRAPRHWTVAAIGWRTFTRFFLMAHVPQVETLRGLRQAMERAAASEAALGPGAQADSTSGGWQVVQAGSRGWRRRSLLWAQGAATWSLLRRWRCCCQAQREYTHVGT